MVDILLLICEGIRIILALTYPISNFILDLVYRVLMGSTKTLPPIDNKILLIPAAELAEKIRKRQLTCKEVMRAYIQRSQLIHDSINAVTDQRYLEALQEAKEVDRFLDSGVKTEQQVAEETPLLGVPFTCKEALGIKEWKWKVFNEFQDYIKMHYKHAEYIDNNNTYNLETLQKKIDKLHDLFIITPIDKASGLAQTTGLVQAKGHLAEEDGDAPAQYRKAGAIPVTVTNVSESCMWWETANNIYGTTKNPYDNRRTVGGSTGGEGAQLTGAGAVIGIGNDIGGSIRIPSAFCGIYGHKPSRGIVSTWESFPTCLNPEKVDNRPERHFISVGPMCRYASDLSLLLNVISGYDKRLRLNEKVDFRKVKVYYMNGMPGKFSSSRPEIKRALKKATKHFEEEFGIKPIALDIKEMSYAFSIWFAKFREVGAPPLKDSLCYGKTSLNLHLELLKCLFRCSDHTLPLLIFSLIKPMGDETYQKCLEAYNELHKKFEDIFSEDAIFLFPTHPEPPPHLNIPILKMANAAYTAIFNFLGYPVTAIPAGLSNGLPISIQAISGHFKDHLTIAAAQELDKVFSGWISPCPITG